MSKLRIGLFEHHIIVCAPHADPLFNAGLGTHFRTKAPPPGLIFVINRPVTPQAILTGSRVYPLPLKPTRPLRSHQTQRFGNQACGLFVRRHPSMMSLDEMNSNRLAHQGFIFERGEPPIPQSIHHGTEKLLSLLLSDDWF